MVFPAMGHLMLLLDLHMPILDGRGRDAWLVQISVGASEVVVSHDRAMRACGGESSPLYFSGRWVLEMYFDADLRTLRECAVLITEFVPGSNMSDSVVDAMATRAGDAWRCAGDMWEDDGTTKSGASAGAAKTAATSGGGAVRGTTATAAERARAETLPGYEAVAALGGSAAAAAGGGVPPPLPAGEKPALMIPPVAG
mgnify:FL=1